MEAARSFACAVLWAASSALAADQTPLRGRQEEIHVTAIEVIADIRDRSGRVPSDLTAADLLLTEDGIEQKIVAVEFLDVAREASAPVRETVPNAAPAGEWQMVIYLDGFFSSLSHLRNAVQSLSQQSEQLAALGPVDVVLANPTPTRVLEGSRDPAAIRRALKTALAGGTFDWLVRHRRRFVADRDIRAARPDPDAITMPVISFDQVRPYVLEEISAVERFQRALIRWFSRYPRRTPRAVLMVSGGFDIDPIGYYLPYVAASPEAQRLRQEFNPVDIGRSIDDTTRFLAASSWITIPVESPMGAGDQWLNDPARSGIGRVRGFNRGESAASTPFATANSREPLTAFADGTGGAVINRGRIANALAGLRDRFRITYLVSRPPDGRVRTLHIRPKREGLTVRTVQWSSQATVEEVAATRAASIAKGSPLPGAELPASMTIAWSGAAGGRRTGSLEIRVATESLLPFLRNREAVFRVTVVVVQKNGREAVYHRIVSGSEMSGGSFSYRTPIEAAHEALQAAAVVEELTTGMWGGALAVQEN